MHFMKSLVAENEKAIASAPNTLFVFAAGNDGTNNDSYPTSPTNINADNVIYFLVIFFKKRLEFLFSGLIDKDFLKLFIALIVSFFKK